MTYDPQPGPLPRPIHDDSAFQGNLFARRMLVGGFLGLAFGESLRAWMALLALEFGSTPQFTWTGTFGGILLPAALAGVLLGAAAHDAETSDKKRWRWAILSPLLMIAGPALVLEGFFTGLVTTGFGGGAIDVAVIGISGGYALSGFGARWTRWVSGILAASLTVATVYAVYFAHPGSATTPSPGKVFGALLFVTLMVLLCAGICAPSLRARIRER